MHNQIHAEWVAVARDTFEHNMRPWVGRRYEQWLRDSLQPHPLDPRGQVLVPPQIHEAFKKRLHFTPATRRELAAAGYPKLPRNPVARSTSHRGVEPLHSAPLSRDPRGAVQLLAAA